MDPTLTPEELADSYLSFVAAAEKRWQKEHDQRLRDALAATIDQAVLDEREACALTAEAAEEKYVDDDESLRAQRRECARAIRSRPA